MDTVFCKITHNFCKKTLFALKRGDFQIARMPPLLPEDSSLDCGSVHVYRTVGRVNREMVLKGRASSSMGKGRYFF